VQAVESPARRPVIRTRRSGFRRRGSGASGACTRRAPGWSIRERVPCGSCPPRSPCDPVLRKYWIRTELTPLRGLRRAVRDTTDPPSDRRATRGARRIGAGWLASRTSAGARVGV